MVAGCKNAPAPSETAATPTPAQTPAVENIFTFTEDNYPIVDGSTSMVPLAEAVASVLLGKNRTDCSEYAQFTRTTNAYKNLINGVCDIIIVAEPGAEVYDLKEETGFEWDMSAIANDALIFVVNADNPVDNLTTEQIQKIYTGSITNWSEVGGDDVPIEAFQRNASAGSQVLMEKLVMDGLTMMNPGVAYAIESMMGLMEAVKNFEDSAAAIGYSVYYYANDMKMAEGLKIISVDGVEPSAATIKSGEYPHRSEYYAVIAADEQPDSPARVMHNWLLGEEGQNLISSEGYVPVMTTGITGVATDYSGLTAYNPDWEVISYYFNEPLSELVPDSGYGRLLPYVGEVLYSNEWGYEIGYLYGLCNERGEIVTKPVYSGVEEINDYAEDNASYSTGILSLRKVVTDKNGEVYYRYAIAAADGSWVTGFDYGYINFASEWLFADVYENGECIGAAILNYKGEEVYRAPVYSIANIYENIAFIYGEDDMYYYLNLLNGDTFGAYTDASPYTEGISAVEDEHGWRYIDTSGNTLLDMGKEYRYCGPFYNGYAKVRFEDWESVVIDMEGNIVLNDNVYYESNGIWCSNGVAGVYYDANNDFAKVTFGDAEISYTGLDRYFYTIGDDGLTIFEAGDESGVFIPGSDYDFIQGAFYTTGYGDIFVISAYDGGGWEYGCVNSAGEFLIPMSKGYMYTVGTAGSVMLMKQRNSDNDYYYTYDLITPDGTVIMKNCLSAYRPSGTDYIRVVDNVSAGYITKDGEWILRVSLLNSMPD